MQIPEFTKKITVLCDCTEKRTLYRHARYSSKDVNVSITRSRCTPVSAREFIHSYFNALGKKENDTKVKYCLIIGSQPELMAVCCILANSFVEHKLEGVPYLSLTDIEIWEVWDDESTCISTADGLVESSSYDSAMQPIVSDWLRIQAANQPAEDAAEALQYTQEVESHSLAEELAIRKATRADVEARIIEAKVAQPNENEIKDETGQLETPSDI